LPDKQLTSIATKSGSIATLADLRNCREWGGIQGI